MRDPRPLEEVEKERELGNNEYRKGNWRAALQHYNRSIELWPTVKAYNNRAQTYIKLKQWEEAIKDCDYVCRNDRGNEKANYRRKLATIRKMQEKYNIEVRVQNVDLAPCKISETLKAVNKEAEMYRHLEKYNLNKDKDEVMEWYMTPFQILKSMFLHAQTDDQYLTIYRLIAKHYMRKSKFGAALSVCNRILAMDPFDYSALYLRTQIHSVALLLRNEYQLLQDLEKINAIVDSPELKQEIKSIKLEFVLKKLFSRDGLFRSERRLLDQCQKLAYNKADFSATVHRTLMETGSLGVQRAHGYTPLHWTSKQGCEYRTRVLIQSGADKDTRDNEGYSPLIRAVRRKKHAVAKLLIEEGADLSIVGKDGYTALLWAARINSSELIELMIEYEVDVNVQSDGGYTALWWACRKGNLRASRPLLEAGIDPNIKPENESLPIVWAVKNACPKLVECLLEHNAQYDVLEEIQYQGVMKARHILEIATRNGRTEIVRLLLEKGLSPNLQNSHDIQDIDPYVEILKWEAKIRLHINTITVIQDEKISPLNREKIQKYFLRIRRDILDLIHCCEVLTGHKKYVGNSNSFSKRYIPFMYTLLRVFDKLVAKTKVVSEKIKNIYIFHGLGGLFKQQEYVFLLKRLRCTKVVNLSDILVCLYIGFIPYNRMIQTCRCVVHKKKNLQNLYNQNIFPIQIAARYNYHKVAVLLINHGAELNVSHPHLNSPLMSAVHNNNLALFNIMVQNGANPALKDSEGFFTPFLKACLFHRIDMIAKIMGSHPSLVLSGLTTGLQTSLVCRNSTAVKFPLLAWLFRFGGDVGKCYEFTRTTFKNKKKRRRFGNELSPSILCLLIRVGLDEKDVYKQLLVTAMQKEEDKWMFDLVKAADPMFLHSPSIYGELSEKVRGYKLRHAGQIKEYLFSPSIPDLFALCVSCVRKLLYEQNMQCSLLPLINKLPIGVIHAVGWHLSLDMYFPDKYFTRHSISTSAIKDTDNEVHENYMKEEQPDNLFPHISHWDNIDNAQVDRYTKQLFSSEQTVRDQAFPFRWVLSQFPEICTDITVNRQNGVSNNITEQLNQIDQVLAVTESHESKRLTWLSSVFVNCLMTLVKVDHSLSFTVLPCGSVNTGNKVGQLDEVDLIIRWNIRDMHFQRNNLEALITNNRQLVPNSMEFDSLKETLYIFVKKYIDNLKNVFEESGATCSGFFAYNKAPALCLKLHWVCPENHHHDFSIDFTPMIILDEPSSGSNGRSSSSLLSPIRQMLACAQVCLIPTDSKVTVRPRTLTSKWKGTTSLHDKRVFEMMDEISPNIRKVYRILKVLRDLVFPRVIKYSSQRQLVRSGSVVSSYQIRNAVFHELISLEHKDKRLIDSWDDSLLCERLIGSLDNLVEQTETCPLISFLKRGLSRRMRYSSPVWDKFISKDIKQIQSFIKQPDSFTRADKAELQDKKNVVYVIKYNPWSIGGSKNAEFHRYNKATLFSNPDQIRQDLIISECDDIYFYETNATMLRKIMNTSLGQSVAQYVLTKDVNQYTESV